jgi:Flp pilus assembly pilin Flp
MLDRINRLKVTIAAHAAGEDGQTLVEYAVLVVFVAMAVLVGVSVLGVNLLGFFNSFANAL